jgi:phage tail sheath protein FI
MIDPTKTGPAAIRDTFPGGAVLGAYSRIDSTRGVAKAPAGYDVDIRNAVGLVTNYTTANTESLYSTYGVNLFKSIPGGGIIINGARTMDKSTPGRYIPIRRSLNYLKQSLTDATQFAIFEPNDERLWTRITMTVSSLLSEFWRSGGLKGTNANEAFYVTCDSTNNTVTTINNGEVRIEVGVALQYPAEFIIINLSQWTGGSNAVSNL